MSPPCSVTLEPERAAKERSYIFTDGQERAALGHSDFRKAILKETREMRTKRETFVQIKTRIYSQSH